MLTIFATCKPFKGQAAIHQNNAIRSWLQIPDVEVFAFDTNKADVLSLLRSDIRCFKLYRKHESGLPYIDAMFQAAQENASNDLLVYANADLILLPDLLLAVKRVADMLDKFLMVGQRYDIELNKLLDYSSPTWEDRLRNHVQATGILHSVSGKDWIAFRRPLELKIPPFVVGRVMWDNWMVDAALKAGIPVVDATQCVTAIHPIHDYPSGWLWDELSEYNRKLGNVPPNKGRISEATRVMTVKGDNNDE